MQWGNCNISKVSVDAATGKISLVGKIDEADKVFKNTAKVTWLANDPDSLIEIDVMEYDHLITKPKIEDGDDPADVFNKNSIQKSVAYAEGACRQIQKGCYFQFQRRGLHICDKIMLMNRNMVCNYIPDGKLTGMSTVTGMVDVKASAKGLGTVEKKKQEGAGVNEAGEKSKGQLNKEAAKAKKMAAKA